MKKIRDLPSSIRSRLLNLSKRSGSTFNEIMQTYAIERFLYRLSHSEHKEKFVLKGALMFVVWGTPFTRTTRDIDLSGHTSSTLENFEKIFQEICLQTVEADGLNFDPASVKAERIREGAGYEGVRLNISGNLGKARIKLQVDIGFGDPIVPRSVPIEYPTLLSTQPLLLHGYPPETVISEKLQIMLSLGRLNSRMKDFYDLWLLSHTLQFQGSILQNAIRQTFQHRNTKILNDSHFWFDDDFCKSKQNDWEAFLQRSRLENAPLLLAEVIDQLAPFLLPLLRSLEDVESSKETWKPGMGWTKYAEIQEME